MRHGRQRTGVPHVMSKTTRIMSCSPQAVFDVLADGWTYATWVVGAARIRAVDESFPAPGSKVHHSVGAWPLMISDATEVVTMAEPDRIELRVAVWPFGAAKVEIACAARGDRTEVTMFEESTSGPARFIPKPLEDVLLRLRNAESLQRLAYLAESGARSGPGVG